VLRLKGGGELGVVRNFSGPPPQGKRVRQHCETNTPPSLAPPSHRQSGKPMLPPLFPPKPRRRYDLDPK
jgi:hypothetical protein